MTSIRLDFSVRKSNTAVHRWNLQMESILDTGLSEVKDLGYMSEWHLVLEEVKTQVSRIYYRKMDRTFSRYSNLSPLLWVKELLIMVYRPRSWDFFDSEYWPEVRAVPLHQSSNEKRGFSLLDLAKDICN